MIFIAVRADYNVTLGKLLGELTVASYCIEGQVSSWKCVPCKKVSEMKFVHVFKNRSNDTCGYIGVNDAEDAVSKIYIYCSFGIKRNIALGHQKLDLRYQLFKKKICFM